MAAGLGNRTSLEHGDEGEHGVKEAAGVGHQQLLVPHLQGRHKQLQ